jgi:hypothetical protein
MQLTHLAVLAAATIGLASCSEQQPEHSETERQCIARHYQNYDAKDLNQCVDVCKACMRGTIVTCNTSCGLKGAN